VFRGPWAAGQDGASVVLTKQASLGLKHRSKQSALRMAGLRLC
jgi:hypothetical protein